MTIKTYVFFGPNAAFDKLIRKHSNERDGTIEYLDMVRVYDYESKTFMSIPQDGSDENSPRTTNCIVRTTDYGSVMEHAVSNFSQMFKSTSIKIDRLFVQNPPTRALASLQSNAGLFEIKTTYHEYPELERDDLSVIHSRLQERVLGQEEGKKALIASLYKQIVMAGEKPSVVLFYGPSGVGKTETGKCLSEVVGGSLTRIQFSMMQTNEAYEYLFGGEHSKASFARDLLCRESNVVLIDEFDKVQPGLYNMFYQLFDEGKYVDTNYEVDAKGVLFILTSNFPSESAARKVLGSAMFSRIGACIAFENLKEADKVAVAERHYERILAKLEGGEREVIQSSGILTWFRNNPRRYDNMRIMKSRIDEAIFEKLAAPYLNHKPSNEDETHLQESEGTE